MPPPSNSKVSFAKTTLPYPIFAAEFDPYNRGYLVVGGGGGESKTGVPNQISVLDVSNRSKLAVAAEIDLSRGEDSVQSLASLASKDGLIVFAGINSSTADQSANKNEHLRSFEVNFPPRKRQKTAEAGHSETGHVKPLGKRSLFAPSTAAKKETYQRLLRLSPAQKRNSGTKRIGAVATGMAKDSEVIVFNATTATPEKADIITRITLPEGTEAADLDVAETSPSVFSLAYCTEYDIYEQTYQYNFTTKKVEKTPNGPRRIHQVPFPDETETSGARPKIRALRFLDNQNVIALLNRPGKAGAELRIYHLYPTGPAIPILEKRLPSRMKQAVSMDICALDADKDGSRQVIVAVAGQDISIEVYTTNYQRATDTFSPFKAYLTLRDVHEHQMTKICFSPFHSPVRAADSDSAKTGADSEPIGMPSEPSQQPGPQYTRLASVSYGNTVVVDTFPLSQLEPQNRQSRYVLTHPGEWLTTTLTYGFVISIVVVVTAFLLQSFMGGFSENDAGPFNLLPKGAREFFDAPARAARGWGEKPRYSIISAADEAVHTISSSAVDVEETIASAADEAMHTITSSALDAEETMSFIANEAINTVVSEASEIVPTSMPGKAQLQDLIREHLPATISESETLKTLVVRSHPDNEGELAIDVHDDKEAYQKHDETAKHWDELAEHQQAAWKERLTRTGHWAEGQGVAVLKGVLFSEYAGLVGQVVGEALRG